MLSERGRGMERAGWLGLAVLVAPLWAYDIDQGKVQQVSSQKPVRISADELTFDKPKGLTLFTGDVKAVHDQITLLSAKLQALEDNREASAEGHVRVMDMGQGITLTCGNLEYEDRMNLMTAHDHPVMTTLDENGKPISVTGRQMEMDSDKKTVTINQNVLIQNADGKAEAQKATFLSQKDQFVLEDDPRFTTPSALLTGRRILSNLSGDRGVIVEGMAEGYFNPTGGPVSPASRIPTTQRPGPILPLSSVTPVATPGGPTSPFNR
ncbi:MAG TPA: LptA/OstA family protein [bacterium]|nr:LptA/OstA family protein [bacterium]